MNDLCVEQVHANVICWARPQIVRLSSKIGHISGSNVTLAKTKCNIDDQPLDNIVPLFQHRCKLKLSITRDMVPPRVMPQTLFDAFTCLLGLTQARQPNSMGPNTNLIRSLHKILFRPVSTYPTTYTRVIIPLLTLPSSLSTCHLQRHPLFTNLLFPFAPFTHSFRRLSK